MSERSEVKPVLTAEEWAEFLDPANREWAPLVYHNRCQHAAAAVGLHGQEFGFDAIDLSVLRRAAENATGEERAKLNDLADRIAALLPPKP